MDINPSDIKCVVFDFACTLYSGLYFAVEQKNKGTAIALVNVNMDILTKTVVPAHGLENIFDVMPNWRFFNHND